MEEWEGSQPFEVIGLDEAGQRELFGRYSRARDRSTFDDPLTTDRPLSRCIKVAVESEATTAVVESSYIDADYRSEYSAFYAKAFAHHYDTAHRVHFFASTIENAQIWNLSDEQKKSYVGYMVVRPLVRGVVGRTMIRPPASLNEFVRTKVRDTVHFFGQEVAVRAVPFIQQDARLASCAQAASWMCHYSAFLGGRDVARRVMAEFSAAADPGLGLGRTLPSTGLTVQQISHLLGAFGLPPLHYELATLRDSDRPREWPGRHKGVEGQVARTCCRYLNSGLPMVVVARLHPRRKGPRRLAHKGVIRGRRSVSSADGTDLHALVPCGYQRDDGAPGGVRYIVHDDRLGPYLSVDRAIGGDSEGGATQATWEQILVPVPEKLWMTAEVAERKGCEHLLAAARKAVSAGVMGPQKLLDLFGAGQLTVRTYAISSNRFKQRLRSRTDDQVLISEYCLARLPRYVWVVEAIDRPERDEKRAAVLGEVVFDSTSDDFDPTILATRLPELLAVPRPDDPRFDTYVQVGHLESSGQYKP